MRKVLFSCLLLSFLTTTSLAEAQTVKGVRQINPTTVEVGYDNGQTLTIDFYGKNIFRVFQDNSGGVIRDPEATPPAKILVDSPRRDAGTITVAQTPDGYTVSSDKVSIGINAASSLMTVTNRATGKTVVSETAPTEFKKSQYVVNLSCLPGEYFYGGGVQNGRFSHRGQKIDIVNTNSWTDGGVCSPAPFYWSTNGYGIMAYTFAPGQYDFGATAADKVTLTHDSPYLDLFIMVDEQPVALLNDYYQLTGNPVLLPKFALYEGHLNAYNRDYWKETSDPNRGVLFEDGKRYTESQTDNGGVKESLNGELNNYQFSARAVVDRYAAHDMPLGWILSNDGYGAGYGQTETLDGNIANLKSFGDYARQKGVEIGLWAQSNLHPVDGVSALLQRDIVKEVRDAGVRVLKTDVAWVGAGYSFGLNGIADVAKVMPYYGDDARPFIISLDGWAGTQRYAGVWTGDQTGGEWEYIRFHVPTYVGAGLSGMSNITSDVDGIFGGKQPVINVRDFQWKTFTPMQLNMDGWGSNPKYPQSMGEPYTSINRSYLKMKSMLTPYLYTAEHEAIDGKPLIRAMFLDWPNDYTHGPATRYQFMCGPSLLVAPIYQNTEADSLGNDILNDIYLPEGRWIDFFSGDTYQGGSVLNNFDAPLWKQPLFVKVGAIIPLCNANNNPSEIDRTERTFAFYPDGHSEYTLYDDDGTTEAYQRGQSATTVITSDLDQKGNLTVTLAPTTGTYNGMVKEQATRIIVNTTAKPKKVEAKIDGKKVALTEVTGDLTQGTWRYVEAPNLNSFSTPGSEAANIIVEKNPEVEILLPKADITSAPVELTVKGYVYDKPATLATKKGSLSAPAAPTVEAKPYKLDLTWQPDGNADYYDVQFQGMTYTNLRRGHFTLDDLTPSTDYQFSLRSVNSDGQSQWTAVNARTADDPLRDALHGLTATVTRGDSTVSDQPGFGVWRLFDFATTGDIWHSHYQQKAVPFTLTVNLHQLAQVDHFDYVPRPQGLNGVIQECEVLTSTDGKNWTSQGKQTWRADNSTKTVAFAGKPTVRFIRLDVTKAVGNFGSGSELYVFKVPGTTTLIDGDVNQDGKIDDNDLTSYMNYTGLKAGDPDFDGYISKGDINGNGLIDAYDISVVATQLEGGISDLGGSLKGSVSATADKKAYRAGDDIVITVSGKGLASVNAVGCSLPYNEADMTFVSVEPVAVKGMINLTKDRLHSDGSKVLYPTFINIGEQPLVNGNTTLFVLHFKAKRNVRIDKVGMKAMLVSRGLQTMEQ